MGAVAGLRKGHSHPVVRTDVIEGVDGLDELWVRLRGCARGTRIQSSGLT